MEIYTLIKPLGIITYVLLIFAALSGILRWKLKNHKLLAILALLLASIHAVIVIFYH